MHTTLIRASSDLARHTADPAWLFVDCRFDLANPGAGDFAYRSGHIPGAVYAHLDRDLSSPVTPTSGRHPLPRPEAFAETLSRWGVGPTTQVVAYDADAGTYAARLWWLLRWVGHRAVAVLDGGYKAWLTAGMPASAALPTRAASQFVARPDRSMWLDSQEVKDRVGRSNWRLLDARAPERFSGEVEPLDAKAGHVPGAVNHPYTLDIGPNGRFLGGDELAARFDRSQGGVNNDHTIAMCGSGVTACHLLLAMEVADKHGAKLYAGSWSEWIRDPSRPVATGRSG
jgi:thiosulfate/3-mercaptopyruvate sulfurtransferase